MKTFIYGIFTLFIFIGCMFGSMNMKNPFPLFAVGFGILALFIYGIGKRNRKGTVKNFDQRIYAENRRIVGNNR